MTVDAAMEAGSSKVSPILGNFLRRLALPPEMARCSLTSLRERLLKIGARLTRDQMCRLLEPGW